MTVTHRISRDVPALVTIALLLIPATLSVVTAEVGRDGRDGAASIADGQTAEAETDQPQDVDQEN